VDDDCLDNFTEGQAVRTAALWDKFRNPEKPPENDNVC
jgi:hypothetical protein